MKKLMFTMLVGAFCALSSSAAQFAWKWAGTSSTDKPYAGGTVYCVLASAIPTGTTIDTFASLDAIASAAISSATIVSTSKAVSASGTSAGSGIAVGDTPQYYLVISDGTKYTHTALLTALAAVSDGTDVDPSTGAVIPAGTASLQQTSFQASTATWITPSGSSGGGGIPEPTSGLLLALGGAMLALRRKRA